MKVLLLGSGGREHALAWKIAQSPKIEKLYIAPGNAGTSAVGENVAIKATDFPALKAFALEHKIDMIVVGPEDPLVQGIFDFFKEDAATRAHCRHRSFCKRCAIGRQQRICQGIHAAPSHPYRPL